MSQQGHAPDLKKTSYLSQRLLPKVHAWTMMVRPHVLGSQDHGIPYSKEIILCYKNSAFGIMCSTTNLKKNSIINCF